MSRVTYSNDHIRALYEQLDNLEQTLGWNMRCLFEPPSTDKEDASAQIFEELAKASLRFSEMSEAIVEMVSPEGIRDQAAKDKAATDAILANLSETDRNL